MTTTPLSQDHQAEPADEPRPSIASLLLPPVGSVDPDGWRSPVARSSTRTYRPPEFDPETRAALQAKVAEEERRAVEEERLAAEAAAVQAHLDAEALAEVERHASRKRLKKPSVKVPAVLKHRHDDTEVREPQPEPTEGAVMEPPPVDDWTSAAPAIEHLHQQFFAPPEQLRPAPVEDQVLESGPDLQLRIYMREILEPWWTGELGSTTALKRLVALRASLDEDSP